MPTREARMWRHHREAKAMRLVRKQIKRNRKPDRVREKDWLICDPQSPEAWDELDYQPQERVMPRGERERRQATLEKALQALEERQEQGDISPKEGLGTSDPHGVVIEVSSGLCRVNAGGRQVLCRVRGNLSAEDTGYTNVVAVGDQVLVQESRTGEGIVERVLPRRSVLARPDVYYNHLQQVIVANVDQLLIVASWRDPAIWLELIDRYLISAQLYNLLPVICVNKTDLAEDVEACRAELQPYAELGHRLLFTSALKGQGIDELRDVLRGKTTVLAGLSGVGKSSLLAAVQPGLELRIGEISDWWHMGRHTTTQVTMLPLQIGGYVVDTPGIREFGLSGLHRSDLARFYPEFARANGHCRFANCSHICEPGCAIRRAMEQGLVPAARYESYCKIHDTLPA